MKQKSENFFGVLMFFCFCLIAVQITPIFIYHKLLPLRIQQSQSFIAIFTFPYIIIFKVIYLFLVPVTMSILISPSLSKLVKKEQQPKLRKYYYLVSIFILIGPLSPIMFHYYNYIFFPFMIFIHLMLASRGFAKIGETMISDKPLSETNKKAIELMGLSFDVITDYKEHTYLTVQNTFQGILTLGGAGAGKSASVIEPSIFQNIKDGACCLIYDFKGNPATLGLMAYNTWKETPGVINGVFNKIPVSFTKPSFELISFTDLHLSSRPNPISPSTIKNSLHTMAITNTLAIAINPDWLKNKGEFFTGSALNLLHAICERLRTDSQYHYACTLPHAIALATQPDYKALLYWLADDRDVASMINSFITPFKLNADNQLAGQIASLTNAIGKLNTAEIYWVLGAEPENQTTLDLNNPNNPRIMSICNDPEMREALSPVISAIIKSALTIMNSQGKRPSAAYMDELPTVYIDGLADLPATCRSNHLSINIGIQDLSQLKTQYKEQAAEIESNMGTFFVGMTNNTQTAKKYSDLFGTYKMVDPSNSISSDSLSISERKANEKIFQERDIAGQPVGHFVGKVANGDPALFSVQFKEFKKDTHFKNWNDTIDIKPPNEEIRLMFENDYENALEIFSDLVQLNKYRIQLDADDILEPYKQ